MIQVERKESGGFTLSLDRDSAEVLRQLPSQLRQLLERDEFAEGLTARLFPRAYEDETLDAEYRQLAGGDLRQRKLETIAAFEKTLKGSKRQKKVTTVTLDEKAFALWLGFLNDMRLVLATALDIRDESWERELDLEDPQAGPMALLHYLTQLEEILLQATGILEPPPRKD